MDIILRLLPEGDPDGEVRVHKPVYHIGRAADCDLQLTSSLISRHHCELLTTAGGVCVRDVGSRNGTFVNDQRVFDICPLSDGDILLIATAIFHVGIEIAADPSGSGRNLLDEFSRFLMGRPLLSDSHSNHGAGPES